MNLCLLDMRGLDKMTKLELTQEQANALMVLLDGAMESTFHYDTIHAIKDWETIHFDAYKLLAYQAFKQWYLDNFYD